MKNTIYILFAIIIISCSGTKTSNDYDISSADMYITYSGSACYGKCPEFNMKIQGNGEIVYNGIKNTKLKGINKTTISEKQLIQLVKMLENGKFFNLQDRYDDNVTDLPFTRIELKIKDKKKLVVFRVSPPEGIKGFVKCLDSLIVDTSIWTPKDN
jgi:hypothetical protein